MLYGSALLAQEASAQAAANMGTPQPPAEVLFYLLGNPNLPVTNAIFTAWIIIAILVLFAFFSTRNMQLIPSGVQNFWEMIVELFVGVTEQTMGPRRAARFMPLIATSFLFILFSNWFGTLPIGYFEVRNPDGEMVPLLRSADSSLNVTAAMAIVMILVAEFYEFKTQGLFGYIK